MTRGRYSFGHGGGKPEGKEGEIKITLETNSPFEACLKTTKPLSEGKEGVSYSHVRGRQLVYSPSTPALFEGVNLHV